MKMEKRFKTTQDPTKAFEFTVERRMQCTGCQHVKYAEQVESYMMLTVPVPVNTEAGTKVTLQTCLDAYFADYAVDDLQCGVCQKKTTWT